jgi:hypothetical protein
VLLQKEKVVGDALKTFDGSWNRPSSSPAAARELPSQKVKNRGGGSEVVFLADMSFKGFDGPVFHNSTTKSSPPAMACATHIPFET